ncbi:MAG: NAD-dependent epimerase/dehydratase family protein [Candidatus Omnitrophica bacterium]|nr:NAD-dependent epimerase/dehydratase family protein [Candidatus Omnitrophota bacterium]MDD5591896.1 NAD-dependent epimerase/dehydratase family protein [Candidatus Omnitrophota bacterium]
MRCLVTGGVGFIGSHVVDKLVNNGIKVRVYDLCQPFDRENVEYFHASLLDMDKLRMAMKGIDAVFHLAAVANVKDVFEEPHYSENINVRGTINVLEAARKAGVKRVIYGSTIWVYSDTESPLGVLDEDAPLAAPVHLYTATKLAGEYYCKAYSKLYGLDYTILRYGIPYGPRAREGAVIPVFVKKAIDGEPITIAGDGMQFRKFVYVEDLAEGNILALKDIAKNKIYNLEGKEKVAIRHIAELIQEILGRVEIKYIEGRPGDFSGNEISAERAKLELGWEAKTSFRDGIKKYIEWYQANRQSETVGI